MLLNLTTIFSSLYVGEVEETHSLLEYVVKVVAKVEVTDVLVSKMQSKTCSVGAVPIMHSMTNR